MPRLDGLEGRRIAAAFAKIAAASLVMGAVVWQADATLALVIRGEAVLARLVRVSIDITLALGVLAAAARALRIAEFADAVKIVRRRMLGT